jgi:hypothetical protein
MHCKRRECFDDRSTIEGVERKNAEKRRQKKTRDSRSPKD